MECQLSSRQFEGDARNFFQNLLEDENFTDVTIACDDDKQFRTHKVIIGSCSPLLKKIIINNPHRNPLIYFNDVGHKELEILLKFMYTGEAKVAKEDLDVLLEAARKLQITGLDNLNPDQTTSNMNIDLVEVENESIFDENQLDRLVDDGDLSEKFIKMEEDNENGDEKEADQDDTMPDSSNDKVNTNCSEIDEEITEHDKLRKYACDVCDYKATTSSNLSSHKRYKHENVMEKKDRYANGKYSCDECDYKATQKGNLKVHQKLKHEGVKFPCNFCNHTAGTTGNLTAHIKRRHTSKLV